jgi:hypothetical protein
MHSARPQGQHRTYNDRMNPGAGVYLPLRRLFTSGSRLPIQEVGPLTVPADPGAMAPPWRRFTGARSFMIFRAPFFFTAPSATSMTVPAKANFPKSTFGYKAPLNDATPANPPPRWPPPPPALRQVDFFPTAHQRSTRAHRKPPRYLRGGAPGGFFGRGGTGQRTAARPPEILTAGNRVGGPGGCAALASVPPLFGRKD